MSPKKEGKAQPANDAGRDKRKQRIPGISIYRRGNTWSFLVSLDPDPLTLKRPRLPGGGFATYEAALSAAVLAKAQAVDKGRIRQPTSDLTVETYLRDWLESVKDHIKPTTYANYSTNIRAYVVPHLGHHKRPGCADT